MREEKGESNHEKHEKHEGGGRGRTTNGHEWTRICKNVVQAVFEPRKARKTRKNTKEGEEGEPRMDTNGHERSPNTGLNHEWTRMDTNMQKM